ncbi:restriction endonuclease subunit S [Arenibacterium halophilum]|uniref:Restriction endonuclease subunit S n=1 Tax=Arenibacterium halophilum TaxID=2583821 RepID=A0ABY2X9G9_9RHOB|nr:restriction endonuclease subunit S [Arenibacterium halophilum]TMV12609.1 restriction endonuclease subunit S [Arenibacterium halophilum]
MSSKGKSSAARSGAAALGPKLRFPEFRGAPGWRITKLNSLLFETKHRNRSLELGREDVLSVSGEHGCVNQIEFLGRSYAGASVKEYHVVEQGDIVYTKSPLKKNPYGIIKENKGKRGIVSTLYAVYRPFPKCSSTYLDHFFSVDYHLNSYLQPIVRKGAKNDMKVNNADVLKGDICVPDLVEQQKIAECLDTADALIALQGKKVEALRVHKKGLMQQIFPLEGETQPRVRFPEFVGAGDWQEISLGQIVVVASGQIDPTQMPYRSLPQIGSENIEANTSKLIDLKTAGDKGISSGNYVFDEEDILYSKIRPALNKVAAPNFNGICSADIYPVRPSDDRLLRDYLLYLLLSDGFLEHAKRNSERGKIPKINRAGLLSYRALLPEPREQRRIAESLISLDELIDAEARNLETLKTHKKGLMQQLFPQVGERDA